MTVREIDKLITILGRAYDSGDAWQALVSVRQLIAANLARRHGALDLHVVMEQHRRLATAMAGRAVATARA